MSRSGYSEDCDNLGLWRAAVESAIRGERGQFFLGEMAAALDAMPVKELVADDFVRDAEHVCAMGAVAVRRQIDVADLDVYDPESVGQQLGIAKALAAEIAFENDGGFYGGSETPAARWKRMRAWVEKQMFKAPADPSGSAGQR